MAHNQNQDPTPSANKQAELVVAYYQQKLAQAQEENANLWAANQILGETLKAERGAKDPNA